MSSFLIPATSEMLRIAICHAHFIIVLFCRGTLCSGCDLIAHVLDCFATYWSETWGFGISFRHAFACEIDPQRQEFLRRTWDPECIFDDITKMNQEKAYCVKASRQVPWSRMVFQK